MFSRENARRFYSVCASQLMHIVVLERPPTAGGARTEDGSSLSCLPVKKDRIRNPSTKSAAES